jgi:hypothetical protein
LSLRISVSPRGFIFLHVAHVKSYVSLNQFFLNKFRSYPQISISRILVATMRRVFRLARRRQFPRRQIQRSRAARKNSEQKNKGRKRCAPCPIDLIA